MMAYRELLDRILSGEIDSPKKLDEAKRAYSVEHGLDHFIRNSEILDAAHPKERKKIVRFLQKKPTRTVSGVAVVAAMTSPHECPHGRCRYCPGGPEGGGVPQSYTGKEPATRRAIRYNYDPYLQTSLRLHQLKKIGHPVEKAELIVMGGTLTARCLDYQDWFVKQCLQAMNDFSQTCEYVSEHGEEAFIKNHLSTPKKFRYTEDVQKVNESAPVRCVGVTFEPRPDWAKREQIDYMLSFGVTRVEIGVQNPDDELYEEIERGHTVQDVVEATRELRDSGIKVGYHMMPGLRGYDPDFDLAAFEKIFGDSRFRPDMLKIYPCIVMQGTDYSEKYGKGEFTPMNTGEAVDLIVKVKALLPPWVRTMRIMRDIPSNIVEAGIKSSNLGQLVYDEMKRQNVKCSCIRCREVGHHLRHGIEPAPCDIELVRRDYEAGGGMEVFLSFEDTVKDILVGFTRLRIPGNPFRSELGDDAALIRELHVYGPMLEVGERPEYEWQHRGYGQELLREAERISYEEYGKAKLAVISGVGVRPYYRRLGYARDGPYMSLKLGL